MTGDIWGHLGTFFRTFAQGTFGDIFPIPLKGVYRDKCPLLNAPGNLTIYEREKETSNV
jgi:hypothetical protein